MRDRGQHVKGRAAFGREARVGHRRMVQIEREVLRQYPVLVNIVEQPFIARAEQYHMVRNTRPCAFDAQMQNEQRR